MATWRRGTLLITATTRPWPSSMKEIMRHEEGLQIFSNFDTLDQGRSRQRVCVLNEDHPEFEFNRRLIENAPELLELIDKDSELYKYITNGKSSTTP